MCFFVHKPVANKKDDCTDHKETHDIKVDLQMRIFIVDVQHRNTQNPNNQNIQKHGTVE